MQTKRHSPARPILLATLLLSVFGCAGNESQPVSHSASNDRSTSTASSNTAEESGIESENDAAVSVEIASWQDLQAWIADQQGKVVVVDVWSTYCLPCRKEFPHFVALDKRLHEQVACASLSIDFYGGEENQPESVRPQVLEFLQSQQATTKNFISKDPDTDVLKKIATIAIPAAIVYDKQGNLSKVFNNDEGAYGTGGFTYDEHIVPLVEDLIGD